MTTTAAALLPVYFVNAVAPDGITVLGTFVPPSALWGFGVGTAALVVFLVAPVIGAIADYTLLKKRFLFAFAYGGSLFASLLFFARPGAIWWTLTMFVCAQICFTAGNVVYDAFLPQLVPDDEIDRISGRGYAYGYIGGGLQFAVALGLVSMHQQLGLSQSMAVRLALLMAGLWWAGFSIYTFLYLEEKDTRFEKPIERVGFKALVRVGLARTINTTLRVPQFTALALFLLAFFLYNDGIQTVISVSSAYGGDELELTSTTVMVTFLIVQLIAFFGALGFSRLAETIGTKHAIITALMGWIGVVVYAYFLEAGQAIGFMCLGVVVGTVMGGSQALSRSLYASMIPKDASAEFFGFFSVFNKLSAVIGPFLFGGIAAAFGSARPAILFLITFFVLGTILLLFVDEDQAREDRKRWPEIEDRIDPVIE
jgi:UMF1 family MFS transporter